MAKNKLKSINYDPEADVIAFYVGEGQEEEFVEVAPGVALEMDKKGSVIGVEIMNASKVLRPFLRSLEKRSFAHVK